MGHFGEEPENMLPPTEEEEHAATTKAGEPEEDNEANERGPQRQIPPPLKDDGSEWVGWYASTKKQASRKGEGP